MAPVSEPVSRKGAARYCAKMTVEMNSLAPPPASSLIIIRLFAVGVADSRIMTTTSIGGSGTSEPSAATSARVQRGMKSSFERTMLPSVARGTYR